MIPNVEQLKQEICDVGRRMYERGLAAGSDSNLSVRLTENEVLCTTTMLCKGRMTPEDVCLVDMQGEQLAGKRRRTSEILLHLEIYKVRPDVQAVVHAHPPHATAFAVTGKPVPQAVTAETVLFLGEVPIAPYETPGTAAFAQTILPFVERTNVCLLAHHGSVTYANSLEQAYCLTEMLDAYCKMLILAQPLGPIKTIPAEKMQELHELRVRYGLLPPQQTEKTKQ